MLDDEQGVDRAGRRSMGQSEIWHTCWRRHLKDASAGHRTYTRRIRPDPLRDRRQAEPINACLGGRIAVRPARHRPPLPQSPCLPAYVRDHWEGVAVLDGPAPGGRQLCER